MRLEFKGASSGPILGTWEVEERGEGDEGWPYSCSQGLGMGLSSDLLPGDEGHTEKEDVVRGFCG